MNQIKERLKNYKFLKAKKRELEFRLQELAYSIGPSSLTYEDKGGATNKISSATERQAIKLVEAEEELKKLIEEHGIEIERIENALDMLNERERQAIVLKFIEGYEMATVCYKLDRGITTVKFYIKSGLRKMENLLTD